MLAHAFNLSAREAEGYLCECKANLVNTESSRPVGVKGRPCFKKRPPLQKKMDVISLLHPGRLRPREMLGIVWDLETG